MIRTLICAGAAALALTTAAQAHEFRTLYSTAYGAPSAVSPDATGRLFVPLYNGGKNSRGALLRLDGDGNAKTLFNFKADGPANPSSPVLRDADGVFYGIAAHGSATHPGTLVYKIDHGRLTTLHFFDDGSGGWTTPALVRDAQGNLYGTSSAGGQHGRGYVFKIAPDGTTTVLHDFNLLDGTWPSGGVLIDAQGNLIGTTFMGGIRGCGTIFRIAPDGTFTTVHAFDAWTEGCQIWGGMVADGDGNYYGIANYAGPRSEGTVFKWNAKGKVSVLHAFASTDGQGARPRGTLVRDTRTGALYGTTETGGYWNAGTVFKLAPQSGKTTLLHEFSYNGENGDGATPTGALSLDAAGNLYGTTVVQGVVFEITK